MAFERGCVDWRFAGPIVRLCLIGVLAGCASVPRVLPPPMDSVGPQYAMAVVPVRDIPGSNFSHRPYGETLAKGALAGAGTGAVGAAVLLGVGALVFPPNGVPLALGMAPVLVGAGAASGLAGTAFRGPGWEGSTDVPEQQRAALVHALDGVVSGMPLPDMSADAVVRNVARFTPLRAEVVADAPRPPERICPTISPLWLAVSGALSRSGTAAPGSRARRRKRFRCS